MAETITVGCDYISKKWMWYDIAEDLKIQGDFDGVTIDPFSVNAHGYYCKITIYLDR